MSISRAFIFLIAVALIALPVAAVLLVRSAQDDELSTLTEVIERIEKDFVNKDEVDVDDLEVEAIRGVIEALDDPYSAYASPAQAEITFNFSGEFEGIGAEIGVRDGQLLVLQPLPGSPAEQAGLMPGDVILKVDGESIEGLPTLEVVSHVRGPKGTDVVLTVSRSGAPVPLDVTITRDTIIVMSVASRILDADRRIGYLSLSSFDGRAPEDVRSALTALRDSGAQAIVLDLRNNAGGLVDSAVAIASEFLDGGALVTLVDSNGERTDFTLEEGGAATDLPLAVLANSFTASAAEILVGAFQDRDRATIVGAPTFGKGSVNMAFSLQNDGGLFLTTGRWLTPSGRLIEGEGLEPDVRAGTQTAHQAIARLSQLLQDLCAEKDKSEVRDALSPTPDALAALNRLCNTRLWNEAAPSTDEALAAAIQILQTELGG